MWIVTIEPEPKHFMSLLQDIATQGYEVIVRRNGGRGVYTLTFSCHEDCLINFQHLRNYRAIPAANKSSVDFSTTITYNTP